MSLEDEVARMIDGEAFEAGPVYGSVAIVPRPYRRDEAVAKARAILARVVPEGWVVVPREATEVMVEAGWIDKEDVNPDEIWSAMLASAPPPPAARGEG